MNAACGANDGDPLFTVVIPLYNKERYIERALTSVAAQTVGSFEALIVDDGSTDGGGAVVSAFAAKDERFRLVSQKNAGVSAARNRGVREARGSIVCFLDADDEWASCHLGTISRLRESFPEAVVWFDQHVVRGRGSDRVDPWMRSCEVREGILESYCQAMVVSPNIVNSSNVAISRRVLARESIAFVEKDAIGEDLELWLRLALKHPFAYSTSVGAFYHRDTESNARTLNAVHYPRGYFRLIEEALVRSDVSEGDKRALTHVRDRKMVAYIFSLMTAGERAKARVELGKWHPLSSYARFKPFLSVASVLPRWCLTFVNWVHMKAQ